MTPEDFDRRYHINIRGQFFCAQQAVRHMRSAGRGGLVNLTSVLGLGAVAGVSVYAGTKGPSSPGPASSPSSWPRRSGSTPWRRG